MNTWKWMLALGLCSLQTCVEAKGWDSLVELVTGKERPRPPTIRVLVVQDRDKIHLEVKGKYSLFDPYTDSYISSRFIGKSRDVEAMSDGLKWGEAFPGLYQLKIRPDEATAFTEIDSHSYEGWIFLYDVGGKISVVDQLPIEEYLAGILADYPTEGVHPEVLAAMIIVARTNAYFQAVHPRNTYWAVDAEKVGFQGKVELHEALEKALRVTRYMIMSRTGVYEGVTTPFPAVFDPLVKGVPVKEAVRSKISLQEAQKMAESGAHAAQILHRAFPGTSIMLMDYETR